MIAALLPAVLLAVSPTPPSRGLSSACPRERGRILEQPQAELTEEMHPTHDRVSYLVDLGSDGRIRRTALVESSGDAAADAAAGQALAHSRFAVPTGGCASASTALLRWWRIPVGAFGEVSPAPSDAAAPASVAPATPTPVAAPQCARAFVRTMGFPLPQRRQVPGTALVDVALDAKAHVTAVHLARSTGNRKTDYAATIAARNGRYMFLPQAGCAPAATAYQLELTFR